MSVYLLYQKASKKHNKPHKKKHPLFEQRPRNYHIGNHIQPKRDITRFIRWPKYILFQRQRRILLSRVKIPPPINQFSKKNSIDRDQSHQQLPDKTLLKILKKYKPQTHKEKTDRLRQQAKKKQEGKVIQKKIRPKIHYGLNHVTNLVQSQKAKLCIIANDVQPIQLVVWLPQLCRKMNVPFCIMKRKEALGTLVNQKTATCLAITQTLKQDQVELNNLCNIFRTKFNDNINLRRQQGGGQLGIKSMHKLSKIQKQRDRQEQKKIK